MKILTILFLLFITACATRIPQGSTISDNSAILDFVSEAEGTKVGKGVCFELVRKACEQKNKRWYKDVWSNRKELKKCIVKIPIAGDVINFSGVVMKDGRKISSHIGVIAYIVSDSVIVYYEQNSCFRKDMKEIRYNGEKIRVCKESIVQRATINTAEKIKGKIIFYRF